MSSCCGLTQQPVTQHQTATHSPILFPLSGMGRRYGQQVEIVAWDKDSLIRKRRNTTTITTTTDEYAKQAIHSIIFYHRQMTNCLARPWAVFVKPRTRRFHRTPEKLQNPGKIWTLEQESIQIYGKEIPALWPTPAYKLSRTSIVWKISIGQLGLAVRLCSLPAPSHLLISWI